MILTMIARISKHGEDEAVAIASIDRLGTSTSDCSFHDVSDHYRIGLRCADFARIEALYSGRLPKKINAAFRVADDVLAVRLGRTDFLIFDETGASGFSCPIVGCWPVWVENRFSGTCSFAITGKHADHIFEYACAINMSPVAFENMTARQTLLFHVNAVIVRSDRASGPCYFVFASRNYKAHILKHLKKFAALVCGRQQGSNHKDQIPTILSVENTLALKAVPKSGY